MKMMQRHKWLIFLTCLVAAAIISMLFLIIKSQTHLRTGNRSNSIPTLYLHGWGASAKSTNSMINYAQRNQGAKKVLTATVLANGQVELSGDWPANTRHPLVQIVMKDNRNGNYQVTREWFYHVILALQKAYHIRQYNTVSHSMGNLTTIYYQLKYGSVQKLPRLHKQVNLAGHFDGIIGMDDQPNKNYFLADGSPKIQNRNYRYLLKQRNNFPANQVQILNIFGNLEDGTNSDGDVSEVSARSLKYLLQGRYKRYTEIEIKGKKGQHSQLHENKQVDQAIGRFLWNVK
ncbi:MAG: alpha/beta hydrolase [Liquorilactobacillus satsumensis]|uniref:alpha/beta hydrolase n=1 Tax=Liquorilactobacillus satsumensis TaxID=259059 RepID=UPI0039ED6E59